jgi:hypothetical protein
MFTITLGLRQLSCVVAYIEKIEHKRDGLREENEQLGGKM